jgi:hypothetical protein
MTVTLAFKAFAKAIPCVTPFLATSELSLSIDSEVTHRISLEYNTDLFNRATIERALGQWAKHCSLSCRARALLGRVLAAPGPMGRRSRHPSALKRILPYIWAPLFVEHQK